MTLRPSKRSNKRLALDKSTPSFLDDSELAEHYSRTPTRKYRDAGHRRTRLLQSSDYEAWESSRRRLPCIVWMASISLYCCIMLGLRMSSYRALRQPHYNENFFYRNGDVAFRNPRVMHEDDTLQPSQKGFVHVVLTRFMQGQSRLLELGLARLALFQAFCLPSMLSQTSGDFIWIIRADPNLHPAITDTMVQLLEEKKNFIFLGSNSNPEGFGRTQSPFNDFLQGAPVWSGNISLVEEAYEKSAAGAVLLETRLDADDGLNLNFIKTVQMEAIRNLDNVKESRQLWRLWCIHSTVEWHPLNPYPATPEILAANETITEGYLVIYSDKGLCSTPGLTFGYGSGASRASLGFDRLRHDQIVKEIKPCKKNMSSIEVECVSRLTELAPGGAVRARTTTSAGMSNVITGDELIDKMNPFKRKSKVKLLTQQYFKQKQLWGLLARDFSVDPVSAGSARSTIVKRMQFIAEDNMKGQCTAGHSCKNFTQAVLKRISLQEEDDDEEKDDYEEDVE